MCHMITFTSISCFCLSETLEKSKVFTERKIIHNTVITIIISIRVKPLQYFPQTFI